MIRIIGTIETKVFWDEWEDFEFNPRKCITRTVWFQAFKFDIDDIPDNIAKCIFSTKEKSDDVILDIEEFLDPIVKSHLKRTCELYSDVYCYPDYDYFPIEH